MAASQKKGGGAKKYGRNKRKPSAVRYLTEHRQEKNKRRKVAKHLREVERKRVKLIKRAARQPTQ